MTRAGRWRWNGPRWCDLGPLLILTLPHLQPPCPHLQNARQMPPGGEGVAFSTRCRHSCAAFTEQAASSLSFSFVIFQAAQNKEARRPTEHTVASYIRQDAAWQGGGWTVSGRLGSGKMPSPCREESQTPGAAARPVCSAGQWGWGPRA